MNYSRMTKYYLLKLFRLKDSPSAIAKGFAMGTVVHFYPIFGFGLAMAVFLAQLIQGSKTASALGWAATMILWPPMFYLNIIMGDKVFGQQTENIIEAIYNVAHAKFSYLLIIGKVFFVGAILNSIISFFILRWIGFIILSRYKNIIIKIITKIPSAKNSEKF